MILIKKTDAYVFGGGSILMVLLCVYFLVAFSMPVGGKVALAAVALATALGAGMFFYRKLNSRPDYVMVTPTTKRRVCFFGKGRLDALATTTEGRSDRRALIFQTWQRLGSVIDFTIRNIGDKLDLWPVTIHVHLLQKPITLYSKLGWKMKDKAGLQTGNTIAVYCDDNAVITLVHELMHMRQEFVSKIYDPRHGHRPTWNLETAVLKSLLQQAVEWKTKRREMNKDKGRK